MPSSQLDARELGKYKLLAAQLMDAAEDAFIRNATKRGKTWWDNPGAWYDNDEPTSRAVEEIESEVRPAFGSP